MARVANAHFAFENMLGISQTQGRILAEQSNRLIQRGVLYNPAPLTPANPQTPHSITPENRQTPHRTPSTVNSKNLTG